MSKFFRATHKETKEVIEFGLEDIELEHQLDEAWLEILGFNIFHMTSIKFDLLEDYDIEYHHEGEWYKYEY